MKLDLLYLIIIFAAIKGWRRGLIVAVFSLLALIVGLAAALKLSAVAASWLKGTVNISARWLPVISFLLVFFVVVLLIRWVANILHTTAEMAWLGGIDKLGGMLLYIIADTLIFSVLLFFAVQTHMVGRETLIASHVYRWIEPWGPFVMSAFGKLIPVFKDMFAELQDFFGQLAPGPGR